METVEEASVTRVPCLNSCAGSLTMQCNLRRSKKRTEEMEHSGSIAAGQIRQS